MQLPPAARSLCGEVLKSPNQVWRRPDRIIQCRGDKLTPSYGPPRRRRSLAGANDIAAHPTSPELR